MQHRELALRWDGKDIAYLRVDTNRSPAPLLIGLAFFVAWYAAILSLFDFSAGFPSGQSIWETFKKIPPLIIFLLAPLVPIAAMFRRAFVGTRLIFNRKERTLYQNGHRLMDFDEVQALLIQLQPQKTAHIGAALSLQSKTGRSIFLFQFGSYESCAAMAQEIAAVVHAEVKTLQTQR